MATKPELEEKVEELEDMLEECTDDYVTLSEAYAGVPEIRKALAEIRVLTSQPGNTAQTVSEVFRIASKALGE